MPGWKGKSGFGDGGSWFPKTFVLLEIQHAAFLSAVVRSAKCGQLPLAVHLSASPAFTARNDSSFQLQVEYRLITTKHHLSLVKPEAS